MPATNNYNDITTASLAQHMYITSVIVETAINITEKGFTHSACSPRMPLKLQILMSFPVIKRNGSAVFEVMVLGTTLGVNVG